MQGFLLSILLSGALAVHMTTATNSTGDAAEVLDHDHHDAPSLHKRTWPNHSKCNSIFVRDHTSTWREQSATCPSPNQKQVTCFKTASVSDGSSLGDINRIRHGCPRLYGCEELTLQPITNSHPGDKTAFPAKSGFCVPPGHTFYLILQQSRTISQSCMKPAIIRLNKPATPSDPPQVMLLRQSTYLPADAQVTTATFEKHIEISEKGPNGPYQVYARVFNKDKTSVAYVTTASTMWVKFCVGVQMTVVKALTHPIMRMDAYAISATDADGEAGVPTLEFVKDEEVVVQVEGEGEWRIVETYDAEKVSLGALQQRLESASHES